MKGNFAYDKHRMVRGAISMGKMKEKDITQQEANEFRDDEMGVDPETGELITAEQKVDDEWPEGFEHYDLSYDNYEPWDWNLSPMLVGKVTQSKTVSMLRRGKPTDVRMLVVMVGDSEYALWETAQLKQLMEKSFVGQQVAIKFTGMKDIPGGKRLRTFEARTRG